MNSRSLQGRIRLEWLSFLSALGLMSRIPTSWFYRGSFEPEHLHRAQIWYPAIGVILGLVLAVFTIGFPGQWSPLLQSSILVAVWVIFTGALHIDGLADTADAWVGGMGDRKRTLAIMKDPTCGPSGVTAIALCLLLKCALVAQLIQNGDWALLIIVPAISRSWLLPMLATMKYARAETEADEVPAPTPGMASDIAKGFPLQAGATTFLLTQALALLVLAFYPKGLLALLTINLASCALFFLTKHLVNKRIGGYTGDVLGASIELQELAILLALACVISAV